MPVIHIDVDSLRPDHVGAYGYEGDTTPNVDEIAADAVQFENAYAANSPCMPSRAGTLTGRYGIHNGVASHGPQARAINSPHHRSDGAYHPDWRTLPESLFHERIATGAVSSFPRHPAPWFYQLWHEFYQPQEPPGDGEYFQTPRGADVTDLALDFLDDHAGEEFYLYVQYWDPHAPYNRTDEEVAAFADPPMPPHPTEAQIAEHREWDRWRSASEQGISDRDDLAALLAEYDAEIRHVDRQIGRLAAFLKDRGLYEDSLVIVTADHGEEFGEHGLYREHWSTHDGTQRIPLLVKPPADADVSPGARDHLVTNVDLAPTVADYLGVERPARWQGRSLRPAVADAGAESREFVVVDHGLYTAQRAVRTERWKLVRTYHPGQWADRLPEVALYDVIDDPWEQDDISDEHPDVVDELAETMAVWAEEHVGREEDALKETARIGPAGLEWA
ncbi:sulfatase [Natronoarchaeum mannanilyticum]|uniref:Sulfatase n=1 Tax=Natronoarchaeum mannanilyticum TaxID=926360 RepID=A0AAV3T6V4_9EURY